jgi:hypothetical protein
LNRRKIQTFFNPAGYDFLLLIVELHGYPLSKPSAWFAVGPLLPAAPSINKSETLGQSLGQTDRC